MSSDKELGQYSTVGISHDSMSNDMTVWVLTMSQDNPQLLGSIMTV